MKTFDFLQQDEQGNMRIGAFYASFEMLCKNMLVFQRFLYENNILIIRAETSMANLAIEYTACCKLFRPRPVSCRPLQYDLLEICDSKGKVIKLKFDIPEEETKGDDKDENGKTNNP